MKKNPLGLNLDDGIYEVAARPILDKCKATNVNFERFKSVAANPNTAPRYYIVVDPPKMMLRFSKATLVGKQEE